MAASAVTPLSPMPLCLRLRARGRMGNGERAGACQWALTRKRTLGSWFERQAAYSRDCSVVLPLRPSAKAAPTSGPRRFHERLCEHGSGGARDDDGGGDAELLVREVDLLGRLRALELVDLKRVTVDTAKGRGTCCECQRALTQWRARGGGALERGHGAPLEPLAQLDNALRTVGAAPRVVDATELIVG
eukprot:scaffold82349_cov62-Phaeocystis_antarctica.AAC.5